MGAAPSTWNWGDPRSRGGPLSTGSTIAGRSTEAALTPDEIEQRLPLWMVLSELWLDTELAEADLERIAAVLEASPFRVDELRAIHDREVAPAVGFNLESPLAEWRGFDSAWLAERCAAAARRSASVIGRLRALAAAPWRNCVAGDSLNEVLARVERRRRAGSQRNV